MNREITIPKVHKVNNLIANTLKALYTPYLNERLEMSMKRNVLIVLVLIIAAFGAGYALKQTDDKSSPKKDVNETTQEANQPQENAVPKVDSLVAYTLPDGWQKQTCETSDAVFIIPSNSTANCDNNPVAPVKLSVDTGNKTDCNQLQNQTEVKKHTCISLFINGRKTLKASTEYLGDSIYNQEMKVESYYFDTGSGVVKAEYFHTIDNKFQSSFDELVNSMGVK